MAIREVDYIIVGFGISGMAFCEQLEQHGASYIVYNDQSQQASKVAGGLYNPVVFKTVYSGLENK